MYFIGDVHGKIHEYMALVDSLPKNAKSIQIGDMGVGFKGVNLPPLKKDHMNMWFRGNHDSPEASRAHKDYLRDWGYWEKVFFMAGAWSIDQAYRTPGVSWWEDEELSNDELAEATKLYLDIKPKVVATHDGPSIAGVYMLTNCIALPCPSDAICNVPKDEHYRNYTQNLGLKQTRTGQALQYMWEQHQPEHWVFGHWHVTKDFQIGDTQFHCLGELACKEINCGD
jgi:hypothetical protein